MTWQEWVAPITVWVIVYFVGVCTAQLWRRPFHIHSWGEWSKPYALQHHRTNIDVFGHEDGWEWESFHQSRRCACNSIQVKRISDEMFKAAQP